MTTPTRTVGITHLVKAPFAPEQAALGENTDFIHFDSRDERDFDPELLRRLDALLIWTPALTERSIRHLDRCRIVVRYGVGFDKIDRAALEARNITFCNNPEYGPEDVADTAVAMLLSLQRRLYEHDRATRGYQQSWQENHLAPIIHSRDAVVGVVGVGRIGTSVVNRLRPFGFRIVGYDPYVSNGMFRAIGIERMHSLAELAAAADMLTLHCPLTDETRGMISETLLNQAKSGLILVNTARGALVANLDVIEEALRRGALRAAALDVLPEEPPPPHVLLDAWRRDEDWLRGRLIITPHNAFYSDRSMYEARHEAAMTARLFLDQGIERNRIA